MVCKLNGAQDPASDEDSTTEAIVLLMYKAAFEASMLASLSASVVSLEQNAYQSHQA